jgi:hypothetical protein
MFNYKIQKQIFKTKSEKDNFKILIYKQAIASRREAMF